MGRLVAFLLVYGLSAAELGAQPASSTPSATWRPIVALAFDGAAAPHRLRYDTAYFTGGYLMRAGVERQLSLHSFLRVAVAGTWQEGNTGVCFDSKPPICESPVHLLSTVATGVIRLRALEVEMGGGWSGVTRKHRVSGSSQWPLNGPIAYGSALVATPRVFGIRGYVQMRYGAWLSPRRTRDLTGGSAGLEWRPRG